MAIKWRKWNKAVHRDFGYFFFGMVIIYSLSGIAINHIKDWNPNYVIITEDIDKMEQLGIYEVVEEDFALCEYICTSKIECQKIIRQGINLIRKETE